MIEVLKYEKISKNKIIGYVDVRIPKAGLIIRRIAHFHNGNRKWFNFPIYSIPKPDGGYHFHPYIQYESDSHNKEFFRQLETKVDEFLKNSSSVSDIFNSDIPF